MSRSFAAVESFLERILERPAARLFHAHPQPVQLERRIERVMTAQRMVQGGHTYVPSRYRVILNPNDLAVLHEAGDQLPVDLADAILQRARSQGYWLMARPEVSLIPSARISQGDLEIDAEPLDAVLVRSTASGLRPVELEGPRPPRPPIPGTGVVPDPPPMAVPAVEIPSDGPAAETASAGPPAETAPAGPSAEVPAGPPAETAPAGPPAETVVRAIIEIVAPDRAPQRVVFDGASMRVGRGADNEIVIVDERVSRHHGRFTARHGILVYADLDSTNGSLVNGLRVHDVGLGVGDVVRLGRATLTIRPGA